MKINNDDPIQEVGSFRLGLDNLTENNEINSDYSDDLHNCSNDLSNEGSIREEIEHAKFARMKKEELLNKNSSYKSYSQNYDAIKTKKSINPTVILSIVLIVIWVMAEPFLTVIDEFSKINSFFNSEPEYSDTEIFKENTETLFKDYKNNILINATTIEDNSIILDVQNNNIYTFNNIKIQTIFYDINNKPIQILENDIDTLFGNGRHVCNINDVPENYAKFEFLITQPYIPDRININKEDITMNWYKNAENDFEIEISNNSEYEIDSIELVAIYYTNGNIVNININNIYDIKEGKTITDHMYNLNYGEYDVVELIINDVYIYE